MINYTDEQQNKINRFALTPEYFGYNTNNDAADVVTVGTADTWHIFKPDILHLDTYVSSGFSYNTTTGEITFSGESSFFELVGAVSIDFSVVNTIVHFGIAVNGVVKFQNSSKLESITAIQATPLSASFNIENGDVITVVVKADKAGTLDAYHTQGFIEEVKPSIHE